ncbi:hypothetical protein JA1_002787 [Spathaspora sp. JA1]|nr:hypothetical protein JA1_002787 [Spathaspora sp. JA1]
MTQEISIVHEFQVLFSNRIRQKDKKWNDGKLQFYEFNNKLQLFNQENYLISTDFIRDKPISFILNTILVEDNEFTMPNNKYMLQIQDKIGVVERDITFKKRSQVKQEPRVQVKQEPTSVHVKQESKSPGSRRIKQEQKAPPNSNTLLEIDSRIKQRSPIRILPKSSTWFNYINNPTRTQPIENTEARPIEQTSSPQLIEKTGSPQLLEHTDQPSIKQEQNFDSGTSIEQADIIYDLSDFEQDQKFADMLKTKRVNYNQAHDFDLSSQSDFDDVDL